MPAATETPTKTESVTFMARSENQVLVRRSARHVTDEYGRRELLGFEEYLQQQKDRNEKREDEGLDPLPIDDTPWKVQFEKHLFTTDHPKLIAWLRQHSKLNFNGPSGFYEDGNAPNEPKPRMQDQMAAIIDAQGDLDVERLQDVLKVERDTHNRPVIIQAAEAAIRKLAEGPSESGADAVPSDGAEPSPSEN